MLFLFVYNAGKCRASNNGHRKISTKFYYSSKIHEGNNPGKTVRNLINSLTTEILCFFGHQH